VDEGTILSSSAKYDISGTVTEQGSVDFTRPIDDPFRTLVSPAGMSTRRGRSNLSHGMSARRH
jgi:hypothetical protein